MTLDIVKAEHSALPPQLTPHPICLLLPGLTNIPKGMCCHLKTIPKIDPNVLKKRLNINPLGAGLVRQLRPKVMSMKICLAFGQNPLTDQGGQGLGHHSIPVQYGGTVKGL